MTDPAPSAGTPRRSNLAAPLVLAVVLLAVIGASVGVIAGLSGRDPGGKRLAGDGSAATNGASGPNTAGSTATSAAPQTPAADPVSPSTGDPTIATTRCLTHTERLAGGRILARVLYLRARSGDRWIEMWICRDDRGVLYYQGHDGTPDDRDLVEGEDALFLTSVRKDGDGYLAEYRTSRGRTLYRASPGRAEIGGQKFTVTYHEP